MTTDIPHNVSPSASTNHRREARARVQRSLEALQRTHIPVHAGKVLGMIASLHRILGAINANQTLNESRTSNADDYDAERYDADSYDAGYDAGHDAGYDAGYAAALRFVEEQITSEIR